MDTDTAADGLPGATAATTEAGGAGEPADGFALLVARFCREQDEFVARLARAGARGGDPPEGRKADGGAHQPPS